MDSGLLRASSLLSQLQSQQSERLSLPPYTSPEGHLLLHPPSKEEVGVATEVRQELASLTAVVSNGLYAPMHTIVGGGVLYSEVQQTSHPLRFNQQTWSQYRPFTKPWASPWASPWSRCPHPPPSPQATPPRTRPPPQDHHHHQTPPPRPLILPPTLATRVLIIAPTTLTPPASNRR